MVSKLVGYTMQQVKANASRRGYNVKRAHKKGYITKKSQEIEHTAKDTILQIENDEEGQGEAFPPFKGPVLPFSLDKYIIIHVP